MARFSTAEKTSEAMKWLAGWQDLNKYEGAKDFGLYRWGLQLAARARLLKSWDVPFAEHLYAELKDAPLDIGAHGFAISDRTPIKDMSHLDMAQQTALYAFGGIKEAVDQWNERYADLSATDRALKALFGTQQDELDWGGKRFPGYSPQAGVQAHPLALKMLSTVAETDLDYAERQAFGTNALRAAFVGVDFSFPKQTILRAFENWYDARCDAFVSAKISSLPPKPSRKTAKKRTSQASAEWAKLKVLPYIDITLRAKYEDRKSPSSDVIGQHLFGGSGDVGNKVRKQVAPVARDLLLPAVYWELISEGAAKLQLKGAQAL